VSGAQLERSLEHYRALAPSYDAATRRIDAIRLRAIAALALRPGEVVLDAGCGTGWCFPHLGRAVGAAGRVIGFDPSPEMLAIARARACDAPVELVRASGQDIHLPEKADAILFSYTHDLIRSPQALANVLAQAKPGARVAATSTKLYAPWLAPLNAWLRWRHREYITDFDGFDAPWSRLAQALDGFELDTRGWSQHYVARGRVRGPAQAA
jgi:ubiquinone/menaquinone biosynthesis C-methylase UbiE